ncbi:hypothetical protein [Kitasatospora azatica]|uniref:hypothetical protein n=1 Tax=Kitasatospora azatica TaxID=58347 RepID=UPI000A953212|nr:hypothetical protein [Kitasatospora azatica]
MSGIHGSRRCINRDVRNHWDAQQELTDFLVPHIRSGRVVPNETVVTGFENVVGAFLGMLDGANIGKMIVQVASPS